VRKLTVITLFLAFVFVPGLGAANIVVNPGFETGVLNPWVPSGDTTYTDVQDWAAHSGSYGAYCGPVIENGYITQTLTTTPGATYDLSFWIWHDQGTGTFFEVSWGGAPIYSEGPGDYGWTLREFTVTSSGASTDLMFGFYNLPWFYYLDDVSVEQVPEPSSLILAGLGVAALALRRRQRAA